MEGPIMPEDDCILRGALQEVREAAGLRCITTMPLALSPDLELIWTGENTARIQERPEHIAAQIRPHMIPRAAYLKLGEVLKR